MSESSPVMGDIGEEEKKRRVTIPEEIPAKEPAPVPAEPVPA